MKTSNRVNKLELSAVRRLQPIAEKVEREGKKEILHMNVGVPDTDIPKEFYTEIRKFDENRIPYAPEIGFRNLRQAISEHYKKYGLDYSEDDIFITSGASEGIHISFLTTTDVADHILTTNPYYTNYDTMAAMTEVNLDVFDCFIENDYALPSKEEIVSKITDKTKALLICNPSNPTGKVLSKEEVDLLSEIAIEKDLYIIADEIYRDFIYDGKNFVSFADNKEIQDRLILLESISKRFSACGARIGAMLVKNEELKEKIYKVCSARISVPTIDQYGAAALYKTDESYIEDVREEYQKRRDLIYGLISDIPNVKLNYPQGAFYMIVELPVDDSEKFAAWLLTDFEDNGQTIILTPAAGFYKDKLRGKKEIRFVFALSQEKIIRGVEILRKGLEEYNKLNG